MKPMGVVDLVSDPRGELADRRHLLALDHLASQQPDLREVLEDHDGPALLGRPSLDLEGRAGQPDRNHGSVGASQLGFGSLDLPTRREGLAQGRGFRVGIDEPLPHRAPFEPRLLGEQDPARGRIGALDRTGPIHHQERTVDVLDDALVVALQVPELALRLSIGFLLAKAAHLLQHHHRQHLRVVGSDPHAVGGSGAGRPRAPRSRRGRRSRTRPADRRARALPAPARRARRRRGRAPRRPARAAPTAARHASGSRTISISTSAPIWASASRVSR